MGLFDGRRRGVAYAKHAMLVLRRFLRFSANYRLTAEACFGHSLDGRSLFWACFVCRQKTIADKDSLRREAPSVRIRL